MAFRTSSTRRSTAASAVSSQAVVINSGNAAVAGTTPSFAVSGSSIQANSVISLGVVTVGQNSATSTTTIASGPTITNIAYLDTTNTIVAAQTAVSTAGGNILITGTNFVANSNVVVNGSLVTNTFVSSTQIRAILPAASNGNVSLYIFSPTNVGTASSRLIRYSGAPTWNVTSATFTNGTTSNIALSATSDSVLTYTTLSSLAAANLTLNSAGYLTGTPTGYTSDTSLFPTFVATDQEGQATQTTFTISISVADANFSNVIALTKTTGVNAGNTKAFTDSSTNAIAITTTGTPGQGTFSPFSPTGWSNYFSGSDYFTVASNAAFQLGTGSYTFEAWIYPTALGLNNTNNILNIGTYITGLMIRGAATTGIEIYTNNTQRLLTATGLTQNAWQHIALVRNGSACAFYVNGVSIGTFTDSSSISPATATVSIGVAAHNTSEFFTGYMSNYRLVKGTAVYTSNFTPPTTPLTAIAGTSLLTCQSNRFRDISTNAFPITPTNTPSVQPWSPFAPGTTWSAATHGGSANFNINTTGAYLTATNATAFDQDVDFTVEMWIYVTSYPGANDAKIYQPNGSGTLAIAISTAGKINIDDQQTGNKIVSSATVYRSTWYHLALVRNGPTTNNVTLYINGVADTTISYTNWQTSATFAEIGRRTDTATDFNGYVSGLRVVKGTAVYTGAFTPPTSPPTAIANTSFLLNTTGAAIYDAHASQNFLTFGTAQSSTAQVKFATASINFSGSGAYLVAPVNPLYAFGTGDFTIEAWIYRTDTGVQRAIVDTRDGTSVGGLFYITTNNKLNLFDGTSTWISSTNTVASNQWVHVAAARAAGTTKLFINGNQEASAADARNYTAGTGGLYIGRQFGSTTNDFLGYMEDVRITKGVARYTANFTAPSGAFIAQ